MHLFELRIARGNVVEATSVHPAIGAALHPGRTGPETVLRLLARFARLTSGRRAHRNVASAYVD